MIEIELENILELNYDGIFTILLALCGGLYHWLRNNLPYYEATIMNADIFLWGFVAGTWATCLTIIAVLEIRANREERKENGSTS